MLRQITLKSKEKKTDFCAQCMEEGFNFQQAQNERKPKILIFSFIQEFEDQKILLRKNLS